MPPSRRKGALPIRRRPEDDGEEEGSLTGDIEDDSLSEGSVISNVEDDADVEGSDVSAEDVGSLPAAEAKKQGDIKRPNLATQPDSAFKATVDTQAMLNGLETSGADADAQEIHFEDLVSDANAVATVGGQPEAQQETAPERVKNDHQDYIKQRDSNPAFVPNRGGFFLHDDRSAATNGHNHRAYGRGSRGRGSAGPPLQGRFNQNQPLTERPWAHDLHESVAKVDMLPGPNAHHGNPRPLPSSHSSALPPSAPNRSFSTSTVLGNVTVRISLPGMTKSATVPNVVKKQHTLLPQHRPPLRRDKPVRISIPEQAPRYIFPSTERSFIFIPRAQRPNQQGYARGRGRGSFHGSRRTSVFGGSTHSPSVAMSRRSSVGLVSRDGQSPAVGPARRQELSADMAKPVVRMPTGPNLQSQQITVSQSGAPMNQTRMPMQRPLGPENQVTVIPMHQPRPQKTISVTDIESPASYNFKPPQQQQEQPFHQQMPVHVGNQQAEDPSTLASRSRRQSHAAIAGTPLSQIPEQAIYAQPFQPYPMMPHPGFYPMQYPPGALFYPPMGPGGPMFNGSLASSVMAPTFVPGAPQRPPVHPAAESNGSSQSVAHEQNGMVFYYDPSQMPNAPQGVVPQFPVAPNGGVVGMGGMMTPPAHFYYPQAPNGMFFAPQ